MAERHSKHSLPASTSKHHHPYFSSKQAASLADKQRGKLSVNQEERIRQSACAFIETVGARVGFPRRTTATAQSLYHRFHLFFPRKDFNYSDVALAALFVSTKMHDTLKKPQQLLAVAYAVRFPELAAKSKHPSGEVDIDTMDSQVVENDRNRLISIERLILEVICFNFTSRMPFPYVIKLGRSLNASKTLTKLGWRLAIDCHRTLLPILFPPHVIALGGLYVAALLKESDESFPTAMEGASSEQSPSEIAAVLGRRGDWETKYKAQVEDLQEISHTIIDLLIHYCQSGNFPGGSANSSPHTPPSPSPHASRGSVTPVQQAMGKGATVATGRPQLPIAIQTNPDELLRIKIKLREREYPPRKRYTHDTFVTSVGDSKDTGKDSLKLGKNDGTVRFMFGPQS